MLLRVTVVRRSNLEKQFIKIKLLKICNWFNILETSMSRFSQSSQLLVRFLKKWALKWTFCGQNQGNLQKVVKIAGKSVKNRHNWKKNTFLTIMNFFWMFFSKEKYQNSVVINFCSELTPSKAVYSLSKKLNFKEKRFFIFLPF